MRQLCILIFATYTLLDPVQALRGNPKKWAAVGDSWASGFKAGQALHDWWSEECLRYNDSYPRQFNEDPDTRATIKFSDLTCSRATWAQMNHIILQNLDPEVELVSITTGLAFIGIHDLLGSCDEQVKWTCGPFVHGAKSLAYRPGIDSFSAQLLRTFWNIRRAAPNAIIVWIGYPRAYGSPVDDCDPTHSGAKGPAHAKGRNQINELMVGLTTSVKRVALFDGLLGRVYIRDSDEAFRNHRYCDPDPWLIPYPQSEKSTLGGFPQGYFHPTSEGHRALKGLLKHAWQHSRKPLVMGDEL